MVSLQVSPDDGSRILPQAGTLWVKGDPQFLTQQLHFANAMFFCLYGHNDSEIQSFKFPTQRQRSYTKKDIRMITAAYILLHLKLL